MRVWHFNYIFFLKKNQFYKYLLVYLIFNFQQIFMWIFFSSVFNDQFASIIIWWFFFLRSLFIHIVTSFVECFWLMWKISAKFHHTLDRYSWNNRKIICKFETFSFFDEHINKHFKVKFFNHYIPVWKGQINSIFIFIVLFYFFSTYIQINFARCIRAHV